MLQKETKRNSTLDVYKFFACLSVIYIHSGISSIGSSVVLLYARMAVPIFFMITGFYYKSLIEKRKENRYLKKILILTLLSTMFYALLSFKSISLISVKSLLVWAGLNAVPFGGHLWYLYALIYVLLIFRLFLKNKSDKYLLLLSVVLICINYVLSTKSIILYRNFLFTGLPYFLLGFYLNNKYKTIVDNSISKIQSCLIGVFLALALLGEFILYRWLEFAPIRDHYLFLYPLCCWLFSIAIRYPTFNINGFVSNVGKQYSTHVYVFHLFTIMVLNKCLNLLFAFNYIATKEHDYLYPIIVFVFTIVGTYIARTILNRLFPSNGNIIS